MSEIALAGAVELGLIFGLVSLGVCLSFRLLDFPDLTADGSFPLGGAVVAAGIVAGWNPWVATLAAIAAGALAGLTTAVLALRFKILGLLAGILTMTALYSINLRIMGRPNIALTGDRNILYDINLGLGDPWQTVAVLAIMVLIVVALLAWFLATEVGLALRATGVNPRTAAAQGVDTIWMTTLGLAISNAMVAGAGALFAQSNGFADVTSGIGTIVVGLASVILGELLNKSRRLFLILGAAVVGSVVYRLVVQTALALGGIGLRPSDLSLITAAIVAGAAILPRLRRRSARVLA
jgi:putative ABC transport system permease protein